MAAPSSGSIRGVALALTRHLGRRPHREVLVPFLYTQRAFLQYSAPRRVRDPTSPGPTPPPRVVNSAALPASARSPATPPEPHSSTAPGAAVAPRADRGAAFASTNARSDRGNGASAAEIGSTYTHTIVTETDKARSGPAAVAASRPCVSTPGCTSATPKRYSAVPMRNLSKLGESATSSPGNSRDHAVVGRTCAVQDSAESSETRAPANSNIKTAARPQDGPMVPDYGPLRATGLWSVEEVLDESKKTVDFRRIDDVESELVEDLHNPEAALVPYEEEEVWKHKLMFEYKFKKTPKHLTWRELGEEIECMDCVIELDEHRPEELFTILFYFTDKKSGTRDVVWSARNDVAYSEGFTDLLAAVGACLGRSDVHRTIRFDDGVGSTRDLTFRKRSRYTSDIYVAFRPAEKYHKFQRKEEKDEYEATMEEEGMSSWGYHPSLMDPEYSALDFEDPEGTYEVALSAHGLSFIILRAIRRLLARPMKDFYRPSQLMRVAKVRTEDEVGFAHAFKGWLGADEQIYPHFTPIEALQDHWLGKDAPFTLCSIINKLREMNYLKKENPEFQSWLSVRRRDTQLAIRNMGMKLLGVGASPLFVPVTHNPTVNRLLPKAQQRRLESRISLNAVLGLPDETRNLEEFRQITGHDRITDESAQTPFPSGIPHSPASEKVPKK